MTGFESPNHTQTPNDLFDNYLPDMGYAELKVVMVIIRHTFGFHRAEKRMSIRNLAKAAGLTARNAYDGAMKAVERGLLTVKQDGGVTLWGVVVRDTVLSQGVQGVTVGDTPSKKESKKEKNTPDGKEKNLTARQAAISILENKFSEMSHLPLPKRSDGSDKAAAAKRWWNPLGDMWELCCNDTDATWRLIEQSYKKLISEKMTVSAPQSLVNTAMALHAQGNGRKVISINV